SKIFGTRRCCPSSASLFPMRMTSSICLPLQTSRNKNRAVADRVPPQKKAEQVLAALAQPVFWMGENADTEKRLRTRRAGFHRPHTVPKSLVSLKVGVPDGI